MTIVYIIFVVDFNVLRRQHKFLCCFNKNESKQIAIAAQWFQIVISKENIFWIFYQWNLSYLIKKIFNFNNGFYFNELKMGFRDHCILHIIILHCKAVIIIFLYTMWTLMMVNMVSSFLVVNQQLKTFQSLCKHESFFIQQTATIVTDNTLRCIRRRFKNSWSLVLSTNDVLIEISSEIANKKSRFN